MRRRSIKSGVAFILEYKESRQTQPLFFRVSKPVRELRSAMRVRADVVVGFSVARLHAVFNLKRGSAMSFPHSYVASGARQQFLVSPETELFKPVRKTKFVEDPLSPTWVSEVPEHAQDESGVSSDRRLFAGPVQPVGTA